MTSTHPQSENKAFPFHQKTVWQPDPAVVADSNLVRFAHTLGMESVDELAATAVENPGWFWDAVIKDLGIRFRHPYTEALAEGRGAPFPAWCVDGRMNVVESMLDRWLETGMGDRKAFIWEGEDGRTRTLTYRELNEEVCRCANGMRELGLGPGDAIGLFMPMCPELAIAFIATVKIGAVVLPLFSGYGPSAISLRLKDGNARAVVTADGFSRRDRFVALKSVLDEALLECPEVEHVIVAEHSGAGDFDMDSERDVLWNDLVPRQEVVANTEDTSAEDILMIIYTSGTTGQPKGAVHTHCGFPIKAAQDMRHAMDLKPGEVMYWMTDMGWMMGPWLVFGSLLCGASMVFYDGAPDWPDASRVWKLTEKHRVTHLGLSPVLIRALAPKGTGPLDGTDLSRLRAVCSTGSPWDPDSWMWLFQHVLESRKPILNYSGGTEISGGILCGNFLTPMKPCCFSGPVPGMHVDVIDEQGESVRGAVGELVIKRPWIGMTRGFWRDEKRYLETYWSRIEDVWVHGDFAAIDEDGLWYILGRSDDTIKISGKRVGPAEVEAVVNAHVDVIESAAIGVPHPVKGEELVIYCVAAGLLQESGYTALRKELTDRIASALGKPLKPAAILFSTALPKTRNAKVIRRLIRSTHLDAPPGDISSLEDPAAIDAIRDARDSTERTGHKHGE